MSAYPLYKEKVSLGTPRRPKVNVATSQLMPKVSNTLVVGLFYAKFRTWTDDNSFWLLVYRYIAPH